MEEAKVEADKKVITAKKVADEKVKMTEQQLIKVEPKK